MTNEKHKASKQHTATPFPPRATPDLPRKVRRVSWGGEPGSRSAKDIWCWRVIIAGLHPRYPERRPHPAYPRPAPSDWEQAERPSIFVPPARKKRKSDRLKRLASFSKQHEETGVLEKTLGAWPFARSQRPHPHHRALMTDP